MIDICNYCNEAFCEECDIKKHTVQVDGVCETEDGLTAIWEYKIIKDGTYQLVEDFGQYGHAVIEEADSLEELEKSLVDDFFAKIKAIRNYDGRP